MQISLKANCEENMKNYLNSKQELSNKYITCHKISGAANLDISNLYELILSR